MAASQKNNAKDALETENKEAEKQVPETAKTSVSTVHNGTNSNPEQKQADKRKKEPVYTAGEFAANANALFGFPPECVEAAFRENGITECSKSEAKQAVEKFMKREVK